MKKLLILLTILTSTLYGQLNPVKKIVFQQWYVNPQNCYVLHWTPPDSSLTDTLIGYNVYRNDSLYKFTTDTVQQYVPCIGDTNSANAYFLSYYIAPFYMHVIAVYNSSHQESSYTDSAQCLGQMIGIKEIEKNYFFSVSPNPFSFKTVISVNTPLKDALITVENYSGQIVKRINNVYGKSCVFYRDNIPNGFYFIRIIQDDKLLETSKLIISGD